MGQQQVTVQWDDWHRIKHLYHVTRVEIGEGPNTIIHVTPAPTYVEDNMKLESLVKQYLTWSQKRPDIVQRLRLPKGLRADFVCSRSSPDRVRFQISRETVPPAEREWLVFEDIVGKLGLTLVKESGDTKGQDGRHYATGYVLLQQKENGHG